MVRRAAFAALICLLGLAATWPFTFVAPGRRHERRRVGRRSEDLKDWRDFRARLVQGAGALYWSIELLR